MKDIDEEVNKFIEQINKNAKTEGSFVTEKFGDKWREYAMNNSTHDKESLANIAWEQGRRAILLENLLRRHIKAAIKFN